MLDLDALLPVLAFPGHLAICAVGYNRLHALPLNKTTRDFFERLLMLWGGAFLLLATWFTLQATLGSKPALPKTLDLMLAAYALASTAVFVWVAFVWLWRKATVRVPSLLVSNHTTTHRVAREIGYKPVGGLAGRLAAVLPGNQFLDLDVNQKSLLLPELDPALDGLSITHLSDLHFTGRITREYFDFVVDRANELDSDLIALTGDVVDKQPLVQWVPETLGRLQARYGMYFVLGNHDKCLPDVARLRAALEAAGFVHLGRSWREIEIRQERILLSGNERVWFGPPPEPPKFDNAADRPLRVLLSHSPDQLAWARERQFDLMLAGHTHGGQICLPVVGPVIAPSHHGVRYASGVYYEPPTVMHVTRGISSEHPVRFNCRPELTKIVLKCAGKIDSPDKTP